jgi:23S rRNA (adenine2503-C2)-methyltransferase
MTLPLVESATIRPLLALSISDLEGWLKDHGAPAWQARNIRRWILERRADSFAGMTDLARPLRDALAEAFQALASQVVTQQVAHDGTRKLLLKMWDGQTVECVMIPEDDRRTACISTQVGCGMGCVFCASGMEGLFRNLEPGEMIEQLIRLRNALRADERLTNIVVMGMGEPLANLDNLILALDAAADPEGLGIGARHITISTVGLPARIRRLADLKKQYHLAVSLHAPNDELRREIVPTSLPLSEILAAADYFFEQTGRQVTFEYVLLRDVNDALAQAQQLAHLLAGRPVMVNLIPFNEVEGLPYRRPTDEALTGFANGLRHAGYAVKTRKRKGSEIDAACGQLRRRQAG